MTIWIIALLVVLSLAGLGYRQGAIRVAFSLVGIFMGVMLAVPLSKPAAALLKLVGVHHPVVLWMVPPFVVFCLVSAIFKSIALVVHRKVEVHFKYKAGDLMLSLWNRLNHRLGLCLGVVNGVAYTALLSFVIYLVGYWTVQLESPEGMNMPARLVTRAAKDLQSSGFVKTARALGAVPSSYYDAADIAGLVYQNSSLDARLGRYPAFLMLSEKPEFQSLRSDQSFSSMRASKDSFQQLLAYEPVQAIVSNPDLLREIWSVAEPDLTDLEAYLKTAQSGKYADEPILGRWNFDARGSAAAMRKVNPNMTTLEMARTRRRMGEVYGGTQVVVGTGGQVVIKKWPDFSSVSAASPLPTTIGGNGSYDGGAGFYKMEVSIGSNQLKGTAAVDGDRMTVTFDKLIVAFEREY